MNTKAPATAKKPDLADMPAVGMPFVCSCWFVPSALGDKESAKSIVRKGFQHTATDLFLDFGPVKWDEWDANDPRVDDQPPPNMHGAEPKLLVGEAKVLILHRRPSNPGAEFIADLTEEELTELRRLTRDAAKRYGRTLTDEQCDAIIAERGPVVKQKALMKEMRRK